VCRFIHDVGLQAVTEDQVRKLLEKEVLEKGIGVDAVVDLIEHP